MRTLKTIYRILHSCFEIILLPFLLGLALLARLSKKRVDVGLGPEPLINNIYHKKALEAYGYSAETFVHQVYYITDKFDVRADRTLPFVPHFIKRLPIAVGLFAMAVFKFRCLYIYFVGGPLGNVTWILWRFEPFLYRLANVKTVVMPYGSDVQVMSRSPNLLFKHTLAQDYENTRMRRKRVSAQVDLWTGYADHVISGCEWVDYMYYWDTLMVAHFSIDVDAWCPPEGHDSKDETTIRILHAPNHRHIKGTQHFINAVQQLKAEGLDIELVILQRVPNHEVREVMASVDIVADQLVVGWYAMFALEAMAMKKPVLCYIREDIENLYIVTGLLEAGELPIVKCTPLTVREVIRHLALNRELLPGIGERSREYVLKHHSTEAVGRVFAQINAEIGLLPSSPPKP